MSAYSQANWPNWAYTEANDPYSSFAQYSTYPNYLADSMETYQAHHEHLLHHQNSRTTESKPRLSKNEVELLEAEFQKNHKPNSSTKKALAEQMRVDNARINNWFQNRRAREKKERNIREYEAKQKLEKDKPDLSLPTRSLPERRRDVVVSSAPFPSIKEEDLTTTAICELTSEGSETTETSCLDDVADASSPGVRVAYYPMETTAYHHGAGSIPQSFMRSRAISTLFKNEIQADCLPTYTSTMEDEDTQLQPPASIDIASRRNRRPPGLAIDANTTRSHSVGLAKSGTDFSRRSDFGNAMRRVASASGPVRITKSNATPRSPFTLSRSPVLAGPKGSAAPPTPDTPIIANHSGMVQAPLQTAFHFNDKMGTGLAVHDPTLRTPPTTPGFLDNLASMNASYNMTIPEATTMTPGFSSFQNDYRMPMSASVPNYVIGGDDSSQPGTPSFPSHLNTSYYSMGGAADFNWSDDSASGRSSPGANQSTQFMNMALPNFIGVNR